VKYFYAKEGSMIHALSKHPLQHLWRLNLSTPHRKISTPPLHPPASTKTAPPTSPLSNAISLMITTDVVKTNLALHGGTNVPTLNSRLAW